LVALQTKARELFVDPSLIQFAVRVVNATRNPASAGLGDSAKFITYGASPRASINMIEAGRALAFLRGREYVLPEDVLDVAADVLRHRIVLSYEALAEQVSADDIVARILKAVPAPEKPLETHAKLAASA
jgi:MoxR-like ATPase